MSLGALCELGGTVVGRQGRLRKYIYFSVNNIFFVPENEISNSVEVFFSFYVISLYKSLFRIIFSVWFRASKKSNSLQKNLYYFKAF